MNMPLPKMNLDLNSYRKFTKRYHLKGMFRQCAGKLVRPLAPIWEAWFRLHVDRVAAAASRHTLTVSVFLGPSPR